MPDGSRGAGKGRSGARRSGAVALDVVLLSPAADELAILLMRDGQKPAGRLALPFEVLTPGAPLKATALTLARGAAGSEPAWLEQIGAVGDGHRHPSGTELSVAYVGVTSRTDTSTREGIAIWLPISRIPALAPRQRRIVDAALATVRSRLDYAPIAFRLLPPLFTLSDLQQMYELLLGRRLHKASFRRALQAAELVTPIDEWRSEGRGRPAQLFRYSPSKRPRDRRGVRFELLG